MGRRAEGWGVGRGVGRGPRGGEGARDKVQITQCQPLLAHACPCSAFVRSYVRTITRSHVLTPPRSHARNARTARVRQRVAQLDQAGRSGGRRHGRETDDERDRMCAVRNGLLDQKTHGRHHLQRPPPHQVTASTSDGRAQARGSPSSLPPAPLMPILPTHRRAEVNVRGWRAGGPVGAHNTNVAGVLRGHTRARSRDPRQKVNPR